MVKQLDKNIEIMINLINHEVEEKIKELEIKKIQEYNSEKAKLIKEQTEKIENNFINNQREIESTKHRQESLIISKYRQMFVDKKHEIIQKIFQEVVNKLRGEVCTSEFIQNTLKKVKLKENDFFVYCQNKDKKIIKNTISSEIKPMEDGGLGGLIIVSKDGKTVVDNSFLTRIEIIKDFYVADINNLLFNKVQTNK